MGHKCQSHGPGGIHTAVFPVKEGSVEIHWTFTPRPPKHPTVDQFIVAQNFFRIKPQVPLTPHEVAVVERQLDAANHAIRHLSAVVAHARAMMDGGFQHGSVVRADRFLDALSAGEDFPDPDGDTLKVGPTAGRRFVFRLE